VHQGTGYRHALLLAAGQVVREGQSPIGQTQLIQDPQDPRFSRRGSQPFSSIVKRRFSVTLKVGERLND